MARVGACKDRLAEAIARFGRVPIEKRTVQVDAGHPVFRRNERSPFWSAGGLIHDGQGRVLLLRHVPAKGWGDAWLTPGGRLEEGETVLDGLRREVREEVGLELREPLLTRIIQQNLTDGERVRHGYFAQFVARATSTNPQPGADVRETRWFDALPDNMAFRDDYLEDFSRMVSRRRPEPQAYSESFDSRR
ncbi:MAG TPA: NUDIX hydrolase [Thermoplasmata archaeon]|nr:NUDIX hydrolase [Thermoplasmata archaeon]